MIGRRLQILRKTEGYTQDDLGSMIGVSKQAISAWETDRNTPDDEITIKLAGIFNVSVEYLLGTSDDIGSRPSRIPTDKSFVLDEKERNIVEMYRSCANKYLFQKLVEAFSVLPDSDKFILLGTAMKMSEESVAADLRKTGSDGLGK